MKKKIVGILAFISFLSFTSIASLLLTQGQLLFDGVLAQAAMANFIALVVFSGLHLVESHCESTKITILSVWTIGVIFLVIGTLVAFDVISVKSNWNYIVSLGILFVTIVQMQLLNWEKSKSVLKILGLLIILSNVFLIVFFFASLSMRSLAIVVDIAVLTSIFAFLVGLILFRKKKEEISATQS